MIARVIKEMESEEKKGQKLGAQIADGSKDREDFTPCPLRSVIIPSLWVLWLSLLANHKEKWDMFWECKITCAWGDVTLMLRKGGEKKVVG